MNWDDTDEDTDDVELTEAELGHLQRLTDAEADGDDRAVEAALRPKTLDEVVGQVARTRPAGAGARGRPPPGPGARPRAALRPARARQDHARDDHRRRDEHAAAAHERPGDHPRR